MDKEAFIGMFGIRDKKLAASMPVQNESGLWQAWLMPDGGYMTQALDHDHRPWGNAYFLEKEDFHSLLSPIFPSFGSSGNARSSRVRSDAPELLDRWYEESVADKTPQTPVKEALPPAAPPPARQPAPKSGPQPARPEPAPGPPPATPQARTPKPVAPSVPRPETSPTPKPANPAPRPDAFSSPKPAAPQASGHNAPPTPKTAESSAPRRETPRIQPPSLEPPRQRTARTEPVQQRLETPKAETAPKTPPKTTKISASLWHPDNGPQPKKHPPAITAAVTSPAVARTQAPPRKSTPAPSGAATQKASGTKAPVLSNPEPFFNRKPVAPKLAQPARVPISTQAQKESPVVHPPHSVEQTNPGPFSQPRQTPRTQKPPQPPSASPKRPEPQKISPFVPRPGDDATVYETDMRDDFETLLRLASSNMNIHLGRELEEEIEKLLLRDAPFSQKQKYMYSEFGLALRRIGKHQLALLAHQRALILSPDDENILFNIARAEYELGMVEEAKASLRKALDKSPGFAPALKFLQFLTGQNA